MLLAVVLFTAMDAVVKGLLDRYPAPQVIWARFAGQVICVVLILRQQLPVRMRTALPWLHLARSALQFATAALFFTSLGYIGLAEAQALTDINPVLITLGAAIFLGEKLGPHRIFGVITAMIGALIILRPGLSVFTPAALLPLAAAVTYAGASLLTRYVGAQENAWTSMIYGALFGTIVAGFSLPFVWTPIGAADWWLFGLVGILGTAAQLCIIRSFSIAEASVVAPFAYSGLILAIFWGIVLFDEYPDGWTVVGTLVIAAAGLYVWHRETRRT